MSDSGDYDAEMFRRTSLDDTTIERILAGEAVAGHEMLASFVADTELVASPFGPEPNDALTAFLVAGFSTEKGELPVTAASNVPGPVTQAAGLPKRKKNVIETALAKLSALGLAAKIGVATGALALTGTAAAATGALPDPVVDAIERTGIEIPGGRSAEHRQDTEHRQDADRRQDGEHRPDADATTTETPAQADFGTGVADGATSGAPQEDGADFGSDVSSTARDTYQPPTTPTADDNPGTEYQDDAGSQQPAETPTADSNPGTSRRP